MVSVMLKGSVTTEIRYEVHEAVGKNNSWVRRSDTRVEEINSPKRTLIPSERGGPQHSWPFTIVVPSDAPVSCDIAHVSVKYKVEATVVLAMQFNDTKTVPVVVVAPRPDAARPASGDLSTDVHGFCFKRGAALASYTIDGTTVSTDQNVVVRLDVDNQATKGVKVKAKVKQLIRVRATSHSDSYSRSLGRAKATVPKQSKNSVVLNVPLEYFTTF
eukprot:m.192094 g.192094  ORF g.192094 m.192094 type:complete len:216 (-) comp18259_c0_seq2:379-1026(-)